MRDLDCGAGLSISISSIQSHILLVISEATKMLMELLVYLLIYHVPRNWEASEDRALSCYIS